MIRARGHVNHAPAVRRQANLRVPASPCKIRSRDARTTRCDDTRRAELANVGEIGGPNVKRLDRTAFAVSDINPDAESNCTYIWNRTIMLPPSVRTRCNPTWDRSATLFIRSLATDSPLSARVLLRKHLLRIYLRFIAVRNLSRLSHSMVRDTRRLELTLSAPVIPARSQRCYTNRNHLSIPLPLPCPTSDNGRRSGKPRADHKRACLF